MARPYITMQVPDTGGDAHHQDDARKANNPYNTAAVVSRSNRIHPVDRFILSTFGANPVMFILGSVTLNLLLAFAITSAIAKSGREWSAPYMNMLSSCLIHSTFALMTMFVCGTEKDVLENSIVAAHELHDQLQLNINMNTALSSSLDPADNPNLADGSQWPTLPRSGNNIDRSFVELDSLFRYRYSVAKGNMFFGIGSAHSCASTAMSWRRIAPFTTLRHWWLVMYVLFLFVLYPILEFGQGEHIGIMLLIYGVKTLPVTVFGSQILAFAYTYTLRASESACHHYLTQSHSLEQFTPEVVKKNQ
jgi:hypothetical protein